ncbi:FMN-binding protein [Aerococcus agrisoli]|uniref:FMN-binding protein n=2 Tax=Aerococcus agrisoli TaxID=2487350 RepID=A0A3N4G0U5_9LACT|nr:FMN-binding protein [Aerococcus agrisoli]
MVIYMKKIVAQSLFASVVGLSIAGDIYYTLVKPNIDNTEASLETNTASAATSTTSSSTTETEDTTETSATATDISNAETTDATTTESSSETTSSGYTDGTYTSETVATPHGQMQLQVTISGGQISDITTLIYPDGEHESESINSQALPTYIDEALAAQSADIQQISGATETYDGFTESLQDALNQALA